MDLTIKEIINKHGITTNDEDALFAAMNEFVEQETKAYASWLSHQVIRGRTASKLWDDYKRDIDGIGDIKYHPIENNLR